MSTNTRAPETFPNPRGVTSGLFGGFLLLMIIGILALATSTATANTAVDVNPICGATYQVQSGDTFTMIAQRCGVTSAALLQANPQVTNPTNLIAGQYLAIPAPVAAAVPTGEAALPNTGGAESSGAGALNDQAAVTAPNAYVIQEGETLGTIAAKFNTTVDDILISNPHITDSNQITAGQLLSIPGGGLYDPVQDLAASRPVLPNTGGPYALVAPNRAPPGGQVTLTGGGFPAGAEVRIGIGPEDSEFIVITTATTRADGGFSAYVVIPPEAPVGAQWVFVVRTTAEVDGVPTARAVSNPLTVTASGTGTGAVDEVTTVPQTQPRGFRFNYTVQRGDTLSTIAEQHGTSVQTLMQANPQISDPRLIYPGQTVYIP